MNNKPILKKILAYIGNDVIATSDEEIQPGTIIKIAASKNQPISFRGKKWKVVSCEPASENAEDFQVNLKCTK